MNNALGLSLILMTSVFIVLNDFTIDGVAVGMSAKEVRKAVGTEPREISRTGGGEWYPCDDSRVIELAIGYEGAIPSNRFVHRAEGSRLLQGDQVLLSVGESKDDAIRILGEPMRIVGKFGLRYYDGQGKVLSVELDKNDTIIWIALQKTAFPVCIMDPPPDQLCGNVSNCFFIRSSFPKETSLYRLLERPNSIR